MLELLREEKSLTQVAAEFGHPCRYEQMAGRKIDRAEYDGGRLEGVVRLVLQRSVGIW